MAFLLLRSRSPLLSETSILLSCYRLLFSRLYSSPSYSLFKNPLLLASVKLQLAVQTTTFRTVHNCFPSPSCWLLTPSHVALAGWRNESIISTIVSFFSTAWNKWQIFHFYWNLQLERRQFSTCPMTGYWILNFWYIQILLIVINKFGWSLKHEYIDKEIWKLFKIIFKIIQNNSTLLNNMLK